MVSDGHACPVRLQCVLRPSEHDAYVVGVVFGAVEVCVIADSHRQGQFHLGAGDQGLCTVVAVTQFWIVGAKKVLEAGSKGLPGTAVLGHQGVKRGGVEEGAAQGKDLLRLEVGKVNYQVTNTT